MKKQGLIIVMVSLLMMMLTGSVFAWPRELEGRPEAFQPGETRGYFIWHDEHGLHLRTTTKGRLHTFTGTIHTDGRFVDVRGARLEGDDVYRVKHGRHELEFRFETQGSADGLNFRVEDGDKVVFDLYMDGHRISPEEIYGGYNNWHPERHRFEIFR